MKRLQIHPENPQSRYLKSAAEVLKDGGLLVYPTDSVYGLGCDLFNKMPLKKIYRIKGNDKRKLLSFICHDLKNIAEYAYISNAAYKIIGIFFRPVYLHSDATKQVPRFSSRKEKRSAYEFRTTRCAKHCLPISAVPS